METLLNVLGIDLYYPYPSRQWFTRCWNCRKHRVYGEWWEAYQGPESMPHGSTKRCWGYLCSTCIVLVASLINDRLLARIPPEAQ